MPDELPSAFECLSVAERSISAALVYRAAGRHHQVRAEALAGAVPLDITPRRHGGHRDGALRPRSRIMTELDAPPTNSAAPRALGPAGALLLLFVNYAAFSLIIVVGAALGGGDTLSPPFAGASVVVGPLVALYVGLVRYAPHEPTRAALGLLAPRGRQVSVLLATTLLGLALSLPGLATIERLAAATGAHDESVSQELAAFLIAGALASAFIDEVLFRGFLQVRLARTTGPWRAYAMTQGFYLIAQLHVYAMVEAMFVGVPLGLIAVRTRCTWALVAGHVACVGGMLCWEAAAPAPRSPFAVAVSVAVALLALLAAWRLAGREARERNREIAAGRG
jgi:CAAX prenyl protease-like protein